MKSSRESQEAILTLYPTICYVDTLDTLSVRHVQVSCHEIRLHAMIILVL
jgi:hypothetical protein